MMIAVAGVGYTAFLLAALLSRHGEQRFFGDVIRCGLFKQD